MLRAQRASVRARVHLAGSGNTLLLEDEVARFAEGRTRGLIAILGPPGSGKTTALEHLAAVLPFDERVALFDELDPHGAVPGRLVIYAAQCERPERHLAIYRLATWMRDDLIEYLLAMHRPRCAAVMARVQSGDLSLLGSAPEVWRVVLDRLAADDTIPDARRALHQYLEECLCDTDLLERARSACLNFVLAPGADFTLTLRLKQLTKPGFAESRLICMLRHPAPQQLLAAERMAADLHNDGDCDYLAKHLPRELVRTTASLIADDTAALGHLHRLLAGPDWSHAMSASLLHQAGKRWDPTPSPSLSHHVLPGATCQCPACRQGCIRMLTGAYLDGVEWPAVELAGAALEQADLSGANLSKATLRQARATGVNLSHACLQGAILNGFVATHADLTGADLSAVAASGAVFNRACLADAKCYGAKLPAASFVAADLTNAAFRGADLTLAVFRDTSNITRASTDASEHWRNDKTGSCVDSADFTNANLTSAVLSGLCLRQAVWTGACFKKAALHYCDLEFLTLPNADFTEAYLFGALLTGTSMCRARFIGADLRNTGLADIQWEGADLREAKLHGASFHLGSTRSGLVGSPIASEGSRTGFYTDDFGEQTFKAPEEIRKANLCGANLLKAEVFDVDFYLVDLRDAVFDAQQEAHFRRCGAILGTRAR